MKTEDLCLFLTGYAFTVAGAVITELVYRRRAVSAVNSMLALAAVLSTGVIGSFLNTDTSYPQQLWLLVQRRDFSAALAVGMGVAAGLVWVARSVEQFDAEGSDGKPGIARALFVAALLMGSMAGVLIAGHAFVWKGLSGYTRDAMTKSHAPEFIVQKVADLEYFPIRIASGDDGKVYVSYDYFEEWGDMGGGVVQLSPDPAHGMFVKRVVADSPLLLRSYGLAVRDDALYVSRSGISGRAQSGTVTYEATGAVTQLKDLDNDGYFEFADDIVTGLPGTRGPDTMQQNNGIAFAPDGSLFVTNAFATNRSLDEHRWGGALLRVRPDFSQIEVFAEGFRNPFGIAIGPDGAVFVTDNDIDENPGDELNHVVRDAHYGHPYVVPNERTDASDFRAPILLGEIESNYLGLVYATSPSLPEKYRNCMYVTDMMEDKIMRLNLERSGDTYRVTGVHPFVSVSSPIDITVAPSGEFFVLSRDEKQVFRIRLK